MSDKITCDSELGVDVLQRLTGLSAFAVQSLLDGIEFGTQYPRVDAFGRLTGDLRDGNYPGAWAVCDCDEDGITVVDRDGDGYATDYAIDLCDAPDDETDDDDDDEAD